MHNPSGLHYNPQNRHGILSLGCKVTNYFSYKSHKTEKITALHEKQVQISQPFAKKGNNTQLNTLFIQLCNGLIEYDKSKSYS